MAETAHDRYGEVDVMLRCLDAAVANLESVIKALEPKYAELQKWVPDAQTEYSALTTGWEQCLSLARSVPISPAMVRFMTGREVGGTKGRPQRQVTLEDLVELDTAQKAGRLAPASLRKFNGRIADLDKVAARLFQDADDLFQGFETIVARSVLSHATDPPQLLEDIDAVGNKISTDCQTVSGYSNSARDLLQASKIAANHTERLLPSMRARATELDEMLRYATRLRNSMAAESVEVMRRITELTALSHSVKSQIATVNQEDELATFDYLRLIQQVPYVYASFVAEAVKRREWFDKIRQDSSTLANEMALFQDEEVKRRRRWHKLVGSAYGPDTPTAEGKVAGVEVNLIGDNDQWPSMTKSDLDDFLRLLQAQRADAQVIEDIGRMIAEISNPTKQQSKRMKAFKNGSIHEAALGRSGLLIRGDDDLLRSLQEDKSKMESKLRTAESRVRRLEDLLHRQTQASRPSLGNLFQMPSQQLSDRNDSTISVRSPRTSEDRRGSLEATDGLLHRAQQLEADLQAEKERSASLTKGIDAQTSLANDMKSQVEEATSTKKDLMENMEALKREFNDERKSLEDEIKRLQARLEDTEDEIEHFGESRENEKTFFDEKVRSLEMEVERLVKEKHGDALKTEGQVEFLRKEARLQRERMDAQERQLQAAQDEAKTLSKKLDSVTERADIQLRGLQGLWEQLSEDESVPDDLADLLEGVSGKVSDALGTIQRLNRDLSVLRLDVDSAQGTSKTLRMELATVTAKFASEEMSSVRLRESEAEEKAKVAVLEKELADGREQLSQLRAQIADGQTGSESMRKRLEEEEEKLASLTEELAARQSHAGAVEEEARHFREKLQESQAKLSEILLRFEGRTERAKDLTQRLYSQSERLTRLLERLGFSVSRQDGTMIIQKIPRSERSAQNAADSDPGSSVRRSGTLSRQLTAESVDLGLLYWMDSADAEVETSRYDAFMASLGMFDTEAFSEAVYRRVRDIEHFARKLQRDSKSYREKSHALQKEAHDKIAFKHFKEGDLALFLPTRNQTTGAWAAFNVGFPHYFLREQEGHRLRSREWLVARISRIQERVVDLSKSLQHQGASAGKTATETDSLNEDENDNPFDLSDGLRWYLIDAAEDKPGAPSTPGLAKTTVAANNVEAMADMHSHGRSGVKGVISRVGGPSGIEGVSKTLSKSLESRRSSTGSKKALPFAIGVARGRDSPLASETNSLRAAAAETPVATSPIQPHALSNAVHASAAQGRLSTGDAPGGTSGEAGAGPPPPSERRGPASSQVPTEVRTELDSLLGPQT